MKKIPADPWSKSSCEQLESLCAWVEGLDKSALQCLSLRGCKAGSLLWGRVGRTWLLNQLKAFAGLSKCLCHRNFCSVSELWLSWTQ